MCLFGVGGSLTVTMDDKCIFKLVYHCNDTDKLQVSQSGGDRVRNIMDASKQQDHIQNSRLSWNLILTTKLHIIRVASANI